MSSQAIFKYKSLEIESVYIFDDKDFIIFGIGDINVNKKYSILFDGKTFGSKLNLEVSSSSCFFDLKDNEFGLCINYKFTINKFNSDRTGFTEIQSVRLNNFETGRKLMKLLNGDILFFKYYMGSQSISIFRKTYKDLEFIQNEYMYKPLENTIIDNIEEIIELNKNEFLGYKKSILSPESLILTVYNDNYKVIRKNSIIAEIQNFDGSIKKKLYFTTTLIKANDEKLIAGGSFNIYIIDINTLDLEITIKLNRSIKKILIRPKGNIFVLTSEQNIYCKDEKRQVSPDKFQYFLHNIKIDFKTNEMIKNVEKDITDKTGIYTSFFDFYNFPLNGLVFLKDNGKVIIYDNYADN
jgi:hypothetical protein